MKKLAILLLLSLAILPACSDDPTAPPSDTPKFLPLTSRAAVLNNLEVAWNKRQPGKVDELLDANYTFFFAPGDVSGGGLPPQWGRADDLAATRELLESNRTAPTSPSPVCLSVRMDIQFDDVQWQEVIPQQFPDEKWYTTTLVYEFAFEMEPDQTYPSPPGAKAQFTVRNVGSGGVQDWRLVELRDLGGPNLAAVELSGTVARATWGAIKALYR